jgi:hypothetical protein
MKLSIGIALLMLCACSKGGAYRDPDSIDPGGTSSPTSGGSGGSASVEPLPENTAFELRAEYDGPCEKKTVIDVNLGNEPEQFVHAANCQITGAEPDAGTVSDLSNQLRSVDYMRRVDVVRTLCKAAGRSCSLQYSDPWQQQVQLTQACKRQGTRDIGAVLMYWGECPSGVNCGMDWANTHAPGMSSQSPLLGFGAAAQGYYNPRNPGFWRRELLDARWAGLQFLLLNTFGPDLEQLPDLVDALSDIGGGIQVALFDDTWGWGKGAAPWSGLPSFNDPEAAAQLIYQKWHLFYAGIPSEHWYRYQGHPLIAFYNAGTLNPQTKSAATLARLKQLFKAEFGEDPFLAVDRAFFQDPATPTVADSQFRWNTFDANSMSHSELNGVKFDHFMSKWDNLGRDKNGQLSTASDGLVKGPELLTQYLTASADANIAMIATWNDLGEGTGINRNYDYYYRGQWLPPNAFMSLIRAWQCQ